MKRILLLALPLLAILAGCVRDMDPFEGGDGVRANVNGCKCVMLGMPGDANISVGGTTDNYFVKSDVSMLRMLDFHHFDLKFSISDSAPIVTDKTYQVGSGSCKVTLLGPKESPGEEIPLSGWIKFLQVSSSGRVVEARFELDGKAANGQNYAVRHGFLRLYKQSDGE